MEPRRVSLYGWDLKAFPKPMLKALKWMHEYTEGRTPKHLIHVGVAVFHKFYHFNQKGLQIAYEIPKKKVELLPEPVNTTKSIKEFEEWFNSEEILNTYCSSKYHPVNHNCIDFSIRACKFLGVPILPGFHTELNDFVKGQDRILMLFKSQRLLNFFGVHIGDKSKTTYVDFGPETQEQFDEIDGNSEIDEDVGWEEV